MPGQAHIMGNRVANPGGRCKPVRHYALTREIKAPANDQRWRSGRDSNPRLSRLCRPPLFRLSYADHVPGVRRAENKGKKRKKAIPGKDRAGASAGL